MGLCNSYCLWCQVNHKANGHINVNMQNFCNFSLGENSCASEAVLISFLAKVIVYAHDVALVVRALWNLNMKVSSKKSLNLWLTKTINKNENSLIVSYFWNDIRINVNCLYKEWKRSMCKIILNLFIQIKGYQQ